MFYKSAAFDPKNRVKCSSLNLGRSSVECSHMHYPRLYTSLLTKGVHATLSGLGVTFTCTERPRTARDYLVNRDVIDLRIILKIFQM
jgi:hypothetical protein